MGPPKRQGSNIHKSRSFGETGKAGGPVAIQIGKEASENGKRICPTT